MALFSNHFWGEKNNGFDALYHIMKDGMVSTKDFEDFLRESCVAEESYVKLQAKLARAVSNFGSKGSFGPFFQVLKMMPEKMGSLHQQLMTAWQELMRDVRKYSMEQLKKHREVKDQEGATQESMICIQQTVAALQKARDTYHARCVEYDKLKRETATAKELERAETKMKKANDDYKALIEKYNNVRNEFQGHMLGACQKFQDIEEKHLLQMKEFIEAYMRAWHSNYALLGQVYEEVQSNGQNLTVDKLLETLVQSKGTGSERPGPVEFVEADLTSIPVSAAVRSSLDADKKDVNGSGKPKKEDSGSQSSAESATKSVSTSIGDRTHAHLGKLLVNFAGGKSKQSKKRQVEAVQNSTGGADSTDVPEQQVDADGYIIQPEYGSTYNRRDSSNSSSDSDSESEDTHRKIKVEIKPITPNGPNGIDNTDDIRAQVQNLNLRMPSPTNRRTPVQELSSRTSKSSYASSKPSDDLIDLNIFDSYAPTSGSTSLPPVLPSAASPTLNSSLEGDSRQNTPLSSISLTHNSSGPGLFPINGPDEVSTKAKTTGAVAPLLPAPIAPPKSRPNAGYSRTSRSHTPDQFKLERADSVASLSFSSATASFNSSRGPSPLTLGMSDVIPLAVAFSETVNAYFKGSDESLCRVKLTGDVVMSFPAGIVRVLVDNPSPSPLVFQLNNISNLETILVNPKLVSEETSKALPDSRTFVFDMVSLGEHLRRQMEQNRSASYFNIDIVKYQIKSRPGLGSVPLKLVSFWRCDENSTDFRLDYSYNESGLQSQEPLTNVSVLVTVDGAVKTMQSKPDGAWSSDTKRATWKLGDISGQTEATKQGSVRAKFDVEAGPSTPSLAAVQFICEKTTLSGAEFELAAPGYRLSLIKKRFLSGKYITECESTSKYD